MTIIDEGKQRLAFDASWQAVKFDDHPQHKLRAVRLQGVVETGDDGDETVSTKAVDVVALRGKRLVLIELKDFRLSPGVNKRRWNNPETGLAVEVPAKVRDSVATLVGALRHADCASLTPMAEALVGKEPPLVVLLLEIGRQVEPEPDAKRSSRRHKGREPNHRQNLVSAMKRRLKFLGAEVLVLGQDNVSLRLRGLTVTNLPGATLAP